MDAMSSAAGSPGAGMRHGPRVIMIAPTMEENVRLGMFMMPLHPAGRPLHAYLAEDTEKALLLEKLGYNELFIGEHFSAATEPYPSPLRHNFSAGNTQYCPRIP